ncbi:MAG: N-acetylmuramoyl-L-alanine amidase [Candidatus Sericytochromatia bacterium]|nr:N-acetylmuramoyl-L-alanine amidase [Candidatus Sericytochromatia bacterium]
MSLHRPLVLSTVMVAFLAAGCGRFQPAPVVRAAQGARAASEVRGLEPCDAEVARRIDPGAKVFGTRMQPPVFREGPDKPGMIAIDSPNRNPRAGGPADVTAIVLHHTASPADARRIGMFFSKPSSEVSSHYVVGKDGMLVQCVPDTAASWHAGKSVFAGRDNVNHFSIGIEICNLGNNLDDYPKSQYEALGKLMAFLMHAYKLDWKRVTRHRDVAIPLGRKTDTSDNFDMKALVEATVAAGGPAPGGATPAPEPSAAPSPGLRIAVPFPGAGL